MKQLKKILSKVLDIKSSRINDLTSPENVKSWDSFHGLLLVTALEEHYKVKFTMDDIITVKNVGDIKKNLRKYGLRVIDD